MIDKAAQRTRVIFELGILLSPVYDLTKKTPPPVSTDYRIAGVTFKRDAVKFYHEELGRFTRFDTVEFYQEGYDISQKLYGLSSFLNTLANNTADDNRTKQLTLRESIEKIRGEVIEIIDHIPIDWEAVIFQERTPFSAHIKIYDAIRTAKKRIHYFDRYLNVDFYPLYLRDVDRSLEIRLVTTQGTQHYGVTSVAAISRVAQQEFTNYQLIQCAQSILHDRNLRIDDLIFHLGSSLKDAGKHATNFTLADKSAQAHQTLDNLINNGTVI